MNEQVLRAAIVLDRSLPTGAAANAAAIVFGQLARLEPKFFADRRLQDLDGGEHAAVKFNVVILKANGSVQLANHIKATLPTDEINFCIFTNWGRCLSNGFDEYASKIGNSTLEALEPIALGLVGADSKVRAITRKFSFLT